jgi:hypothetical protein
VLILLLHQEPIIFLIHEGIASFLTICLQLLLLLLLLLLWRQVVHTR